MNTKSDKGRPSELAGNVGVLLSAAALSAVLIEFVFTGACRVMLVLAAVFFVLAMRAKLKNTASMENTAKYAIVCGIVLLSAAMMPSLTLWKTGKWHYPYQFRYVKMRHTCSLAEWFPAHLPDGSENVRMDYMPSMMQGSGYFTVCFECKDSIAAKWEDLGKKQAVNTVTADTAQNTQDEYHYDEEFWSGYENDLVIYVLEYDQHRSHLKYIIADPSSGKVQLYTA